jgi:hypothetical protein
MYLFAGSKLVHLDRLAQTRSAHPKERKDGGGIDDDIQDDAIKDYKAYAIQY